MSSSRNIFCTVKTILETKFDVSVTKKFDDILATNI